MNIEVASQTIDMLYGSPMSALSDCLRGFLIAKPNHYLIGCDFSAIEARVIAWLAGEEKILKIFREKGDVYVHAAAGIYGIRTDEVDKDKRQIGKVAVLALGYQGGKGAFQQMAKGYGLKITDAEAETIKDAWRIKNNKIVRYWYACEDAALKALLNSGDKFSVGAKGREVVFLKNGSFLWCKLPSGRVISYPYAEIQTFETPWGSSKEGLTYMSVTAPSNAWKRVKSYGGKLVENITQAVARDVLAESMFVLESKGYDIVMHVHDEVVLEVKEGEGSLDDVEKLMSKPPEWAADLPMDAEGWQGKRFRK